MIQQGLVLMVVGMSMVFIFLFVMILSMDGLAKVVKMMDASHARKHPHHPSPTKQNTTQDTSKEAAAIAAASQFAKK